MKLYNTLTKKVEKFKPINDKQINMFVCGPTVYDNSHIGHAKTYTQQDLLARVLRHSDYKVFYLQNITDIDDKIIKKAQETNQSWKELVSKYLKDYIIDMKALGNTSVNEYAAATNYIQNILTQVQTLLDKEFAYETSDGIYFEIAKFSDYGKLSGRTEINANDAESRIDQSDSKRGWNDFCIWKFSKPGEPVWDAPFGKGRPGWHIEDTAITEQFFGPQYDIHGGAVDLIFPHHEAEISLMESISGKKPIVRYWFHTNFLNIDKQKMSKSLGNFYTINEVLDRGYDPMAIRLLMLRTHYRSSMDFSWDLLDIASSRLKAYRAFADIKWNLVTRKNPHTSPPKLNIAQNSILKHLHNDLATPSAFAVLDELENQNLRNLIEDSKEFQDFLEFLDSVFGLELSNRPDLNDEQYGLIHERDEARRNKKWESADMLRNILEKQNIGLQDIENSSIWYRI